MAILERRDETRKPTVVSQLKTILSIPPRMSEGVQADDALIAKIVEAG
jgi:hypothetical protein